MQALAIRRVASGIPFCCALLLLQTSALQTFGGPPPVTPVADPATGIGTNSFVANWEPVVTTGYRLDVSTNALFPSYVPGYQNLDVGAVLHERVTGLTPGATYYYRVRAYNADGESGNSETFSATPVIPHGLTIIPIFDRSITSDPQAAVIESTINSTAALYATNFSDPVIVSIKFVEDSTIGLGQSVTEITDGTYSQYRARLVAQATTADDAIALSHLPNVATNPVNGSTVMALYHPLLRALGISAEVVLGNPDSTITLNTTKMNLPPDATDPTKYSLFAAACHEIDEALGLASGLVGGQPPPTDYIFPQDLFRYDQSGVRSFTTDPNAESYFSLDGTNFLVRFNQNGAGDFGDWYSCFSLQCSGFPPPQVQDAFGTAGANPVPDVEFRALDVIGYTRRAPPCDAVISIGVSPPGAGSVQGGGTVACGTNVTINATAANGFVFLNWTEDGTVVSTSRAYTFQATYNRNLVANFSPTTYTITLTASPAGAGKVTGGGTFKPGTQHTVKATAAGNNYVFADWSESSNVVSTAANYTFALNANRNLVANFVPNPFIPVAGRYSGLFYDPVNGVNQQSSGSVTISVSSKGAFTGALLLGATRYPLSGQFDSTGNASVVTAAKNLSGALINLQLDLSQGTDRISGTIYGHNATMQFLADRAVFDARTNSAPQKGLYTIIFPGGLGPSTEPGGDGYGTFTVDAAGHIKLGATLADGTKITQLATVSKYGQWPLYVPLYAGQGSVWGWLNFSSTSSNDLSGALTWTKPNGPAQYYPRGFQVQTFAQGAVYSAPAPGNSPLGVTNAQVLLSGGDLAQPITDQIAFGPANQVVNQGTNKLTLTFTAATGLFKGSIANPTAVVTKPVSFGGAVLKAQNVARGCFLEGGQSGAVWIGN
ncbi:MAG: hypothetical protein C5B50_08330 [Verrucomicrobia bacterium]|nr:MAG: hypothetical protein C5B50_08330 [Verrucomicrobiota bacterium]